MISQYYYPAFSFGGPVLKIKSIAEGLSKRGHQVTVVTSSLLDVSGRRLASRTMLQEVGGVEVIYLSSIVSFRALSINLGILPYCRNYLREFDVLHVYAYFNSLGFIAVHYAKKWGIPYVLEPMGMVIPVGRNLKLKRLYYQAVGRKLIEEASRIVVTSAQEGEDLVKHGFVDMEKIVERRDGIDLSEFQHLPERGRFREKHGIRPHEKVILFLGRISPVKSIELLFEAFAGLRLSNTRLVVVGPHESKGYSASLERLQCELHLKSSVLVLGPLYGIERLSALVDSDVLVLPSIQESFGIAVAEAIATGVPVIVTEHCGIAPYVRDRVGLVVSHDAMKVREAIYRLLTDEELYRSFRANCPQLAQELSWDEPIVQMETLYSGLMNLRRGRSGDDS